MKSQRTFTHRKASAWIAFSLSLLVTQDVLASCLDLPWRREKPYDYYAAETREKSGTFPNGLLDIVERAHFTPNVRMLTAGERGNQPDDLIFVLTTIPNHPAALDAYSRYVKRFSESKLFRDNPANQRPAYDAECFFNKALDIYPNHAETYKVLALHEYRNEQFQKSVDALKKSIAMGDDGAETHYYLGLSYFALGNLDAAREQAKLAYDAGYPLQGLKQKLATQEAEP